MKEISLQSKITDVTRTLEKQRRALSQMGLVTVKDLLYYFPVRYSNVSSVTSIAKAQNNELVTVYGVLESIKAKKTFKGNIPVAEGTLVDLEGNKLHLIWFHQLFLAKTMSKGQTIKLTGTITEGKYGKMMTNPEVAKIATLPIDTGNSLFATEDSSGENFGFPVYRERRGVTSKWIYHTIVTILGSGILDTIEDPIPEYIREKYRLPSLSTSLVWIHAPRSQSNADSARKRFAFEEIFFVQIRNQQRRYWHRQNASYQLEVNQQGLTTFVDRFPFTPTDAQQRAVETIINDMSGETPMSRLLEGDVGSGKTFVAAVASYLTITNRPRKDSGVAYAFGRLQVAYMAPTEVLATQLFENFIEYFKGTGVQIALVTGGGCRKFPSKVNGELWTPISKPQVLKWIANGEIPIVIGTHALIQKKVVFQDLALAIIDEQHRFGTNQRMKLGAKDKRIPHLLSMTATPIPRTLALTIYGDLDLSVIESMPSGRKPVFTEVVSPDPESRARTYEQLIANLNEGRQAYVICPRISDPDPSKESALQLRSVTEEAKRLSQNELKGFRVGIMHSKMTKADKEKVMNQFYNHEIDVLVSTSVVEVGVNVPNATTIIIEGAERFGLAQLHQLRGRVIRSNHQAYCYLFADSKTEKTNDRLRAMIEAKSGFELAEIDLAMRGAGDLAGVKQWGISDLAMEAIKNVTMVEFAREEAKTIIENDPTLVNFPEIHEIVNSPSYGIHFE